MRRVAITGLGAVSPCGADVETTWANVTAGRSGVGPITLFDATDYASRIAGECRDFDPLRYFEKRQLREGGRFIHFAVGAAHQAIEAAGFSPSEAQKDRTGTFVGVGFCGTDKFEDALDTVTERGPRRLTPYAIPSMISNLAPGQISMRWGFRGPSFTHCSACASGAHAIGDAFRLIQNGKLDAALAGGTEAAISRVAVAGFASMRALSKRNDDPERASRPFDRRRDGFVIAEGAGVVVLEELEAAVKRGAPILAEVIGYGACSDAYHMTQPAPEGEGARRSMQLALDDAQIAAEDVDYVNAHATSTPTGDILELDAIRAVFGSHATSGLRISSTKSMTGHLLGAAGGLETALVAKVLSEGVIPPNINLDDPEPAAEGLGLVAHTAEERLLDVALSNSFGFGGTNCTLVLKKHS